MDSAVTPSNRTSPVYTDRTPPGPRAGGGDHSHIAGWGSDADPQMRPAYPMERTPPRLAHAHGHELVPQPQKVKVFHSTERPGITPVFGTGQPPRGISGAVRGFAFRFSENDLRHWLLLMLADRVNVGEGLVEDLAHGHVPNVLGEMGIRAEWKHNRAGLVRKAAVAGGLAALAVYLIRRRRG
jgi:hypothetical protein